jgi:hypothetical protein
MAWHMRVAYKTSPQVTLGWVSGGWTDNQYMAVYNDKNAAWGIDYPLYAYGGDTYIKASENNWYAGADGDNTGGDARWRFWNRARQIIWDAPGNTTGTISLHDQRNVKLCKPSTDKPWLTWSTSDPTTLLVTWEEW